ARVEQSDPRLIDGRRTGGAEPDYGRARDILAAVVLLADGGHVESVPDEFNAIELPLLLAADVSRKPNAVAVGERAPIAADVDRHRRVARRLDADHAHRLQVRSAIARGLDAPLAKMVFDVGGGQTDAGAENGAALEVVRCD